MDPLSLERKVILEVFAVICENFRLFLISRIKTNTAEISITRPLPFTLHRILKTQLDYAIRVNYVCVLSFI